MNGALGLGVGAVVGAVAGAAIFGIVQQQESSALGNVESAVAAFTETPEGASVLPFPDGLMVVFPADVASASVAGVECPESADGRVVCTLSSSGVVRWVGADGVATSIVLNPLAAV